jgi:hypothetical protein
VKRSRLPKDSLPRCRRRSHARGEPTKPFFCPACQRTVCTWCQGPRPGHPVCGRCRQGFLPVLRLAKAAVRAARTSTRKAWKHAFPTSVTNPLGQVDDLLAKALELLHGAGIAHVERKVDKVRRAA